MNLNSITILPFTRIKNHIWDCKQAIELNLNELIRRCSKNDRKAQSELFENYKDTLYFLALKYSRNTAEAEDTLHDAFLVIFEKIGSFQHKGSFEGWMKRITIFKAIDKYKKKQPTIVEINDDLLEDTKLENGLEEIPLDSLMNAIQKLPDRYRLVFNLFQLDGYSHKEIANMLNISEGTSKSNFHRAKQLLKKSILVLRETQKANL